MASYFFESNARDDKDSAPHTSAGSTPARSTNTPYRGIGRHGLSPHRERGKRNDHAPMRLAQLPTTRQTRHTLLHHPRMRIRTAARQFNSKRIRHGTPQGESPVGGGHGLRHRSDLRQMQSACASVSVMGPRPHRRPHNMDRARTQTLQQTGRPTQSNRKHRTLEPTLSQAEPQASANANRTRHTTNRKKYNQPTRQHP